MGKYRKKGIGYTYQLYISETTPCESYNMTLKVKYPHPIGEK
jgi:hypothetical protein